MNQVVGLIEIDSAAATALCDESARLDDATLDGLFARLIASEDDEPTAAQVSTGIDLSATVMVANLDELTADLHASTRNLLANIFLGLSRRW